MTNRAKPGIAPRGHEEMHAVPAIEADAERGRFEHAIDLGEGRAQPLAVAVVGDLAPVAALIIDKIRWVGQHKIDGCRRQVRMPVMQSP